ncbi:MAG: metal ABC transporter permease [Candidatus Moranbacteria bacterium]|nr:metal ABC transporter permease [Candidatus Moranbacteria bacterium]
MALSDIFLLEFAQRALSIGFLVSFVAGILGGYVVAGRHAVFSDMLAHTSLAGVGIGIFFGFSPTNGALAVSFLSAFFLWLFLRKEKFAPESITMVLLSGGLALALVFAHLAKDNPLSLETFLFGSVLTVRPEEIVQFFLVSLSILAFILFFGRRLRTIVLDPEYAGIRFPFSKWVNLIFLLSVGLFVGFSLKIVGGLLIGALLVIPIVTAQIFSRSFQQTLFFGIIFNILATFFGIILSFYLDVPTGASIVLVLIGQLVAVFLGKNFIFFFGKKFL